ncbi:hypothetical protein GGX14DRAFT_700772, partial [Mycena pura]
LARDFVYFAIVRLGAPASLPTTSAASLSLRLVRRTSLNDLARLRLFLPCRDIDGHTVFSSSCWNSAIGSVDHRSLCSQKSLQVSTDEPEVHWLKLKLSRLAPSRP